MSLDLFDPWGARILAAILVGGLLALLIGLFVRALPALSPATRAWLWWLVAARTLAELAGAPALELAWLPAPAPTELRVSLPDARSEARRLRLEFAGGERLQSSRRVGSLDDRNLAAGRCRIAGVEAAPSPVPSLGLARRAGRLPRRRRGPPPALPTSTGASAP
jgi:hypothetical protein